MSFLIPQVLWALPAAAIPLIIHLLSRANTRVMDFSTLYFLRRLEHESIRRLKLHQWLVVLLRTLLLLILILLLARPVVKGYFRGWIGDNASTISVVIVDNSFSASGDNPGMDQRGVGGQIARLRSKLEPLYEVLADQRNQGRIVMFRSSDASMIYDGLVSDLPGIDDIAGLCQPGLRNDRMDLILDSLKAPAFQDAAKLYANRELFLISDFQVHLQPILRQFSTDTSVWKDWHFFLIYLPDQDHNIAVINTEVESAIPLVGELMEVSVALSNTGTRPGEKIPVQIVLNDMRSGQLVVDLRPGEKKTVQFQVAPVESGHQRGYAEVERDERMGDNRFYYYAYIPPVLRVLLVESSGFSPSFVKEALLSLVSDKPHIQLQILDPDDPVWSPDIIDAVILNGLEAIPSILLRQLKEFLEGGGTLIIIPGPDESTYQGIATIQQEFDLPLFQAIPESFESPLSLDRTRLSPGTLTRVFRKESEIDDLPKVSRLYPLNPRGNDEVLLWAENRKSLLIRSGILDGNVLVFSLPFHLQWTDLPLQGSFIPLWHHLIFWRSTSDVLEDVRIGDTPTLEVSPLEATQPMTLTSPNGMTSLVIPSIRTRSVVLKNLDWPGIYALSTRNRHRPETDDIQGREFSFRVNIPARELESRYLTRSAILNILNSDQMFVLDEDQDAHEFVRQARFGRELWRPLLYFLIILVILEMILGNAYHSLRRSDSRP
ncbi:BatA domain-containing protein [Candidatus Neomarinimicrobiota bacterium]